MSRNLPSFPPGYDRGVQGGNPEIVTTSETAIQAGERANKYIDTAISFNSMLAAIAGNRSYASDGICCRVIEAASKSQIYITIYNTRSSAIGVCSVFWIGLFK